jgi:5-methylcytosine-specific restriction endonuclease McrA
VSDEPENPAPRRPIRRDRPKLPVPETPVPADVLAMIADYTVRETCGLCHSNLPLESHHKVFRSQGGGDEPGNLVRLCKVCHDAVHGIPSSVQGHSCATCPILRRRGCHFGERVTGRELRTPKPW